jgi:hypothetical protein
MHPTRSRRLDVPRVFAALLIAILLWLAVKLRAHEAALNAPRPPVLAPRAS